MLLLLLLIPIVGFIILLNFQQLEFLIPIVFASVFVSAFLIPIGNLILIITFFIKLFSKNKTEKNAEQIISNLFVIICFTFVSFFCFTSLYQIK